MFPGAHASIIRNEDGEPTGWDYPGEPDYDPADFLYGDQDDQEPDEDDGMHDYEPQDHDERACAENHGDCACDPDCRVCNQRYDSEKHW